MNEQEGMQGQISFQGGKEKLELPLEGKAEKEVCLRIC